MAQSDLNLANWALRLIGNRRAITSLAEASTEARACNACLDDVRRRTLRLHLWNFARERDKITVTSTANITAAISGSVGTIITVASHGLTLGQWIRIEADAGSAQITGLQGGPWEVITVVGVNQVEINVPFASVGAIVGTSRCYPSVAFGWLYKIAQPTDCIRVVKVSEEDGYEWDLESNCVLVNDKTVTIRYIKDVTDFTLMDPSFYDLLANMLALALCDHITASDGKKSELHSYIYGEQGRRGALSIAKVICGTEIPPRKYTQDALIAARGTYSGEV